ncbi:hypothetical protein CPT_Maja_089 [Burkholderia phage Maja]|uniref:Uncharacterized protein n=1 Tax=Burkholderia phage Maja TaxID=2767571 RepID=A0A7S6R7A3_9CAUD|nr:hypothetical protein CPT_Maja_089 [Burkholderia phage Maja]
MTKSSKLVSGVKVIPLPSQEVTLNEPAIHELVIDSPDMNADGVVFQGTADQLLLLLSIAHTTVIEMKELELSMKAMKKEPRSLS